MKAKTHWLVSVEKPEYGQNLRALCGDIIPAAQPAPAVWDADDPEYGLVKCRECDAKYKETLSPILRYVAVIESGEESIQR